MISFDIFARISALERSYAYHLEQACKHDEMLDYLDEELMVLRKMKEDMGLAQLYDDDVYPEESECNAGLSYTDLMVYFGLRRMEEQIRRKHPKRTKQIFSFSMNLFAFT